MALKSAQLYGLLMTVRTLNTTNLNLTRSPGDILMIPRGSSVNVGPSFVKFA
jgi:ethanolamine utilization protein EutQ (cupin superfamily)